MIKRILLSLVMLLVLGYLVIAITAFNVKPADLVCQDIDLVIKDSVNAGFITKKEVTSILTNKQAYPVGKKIDEIDLKVLEGILGTHPLIDQVECYKTPGGKLYVEVTQRVPILRVMGRNGENYFVDNKGTIMPPEARCIAHLPIVTGNVEKSFALTDLYQFALFLQKNKFWDAQIEQINVLKGREVELVPRVGDHIVFLGKIDDYENKLDRLKEFYRKGLNKVGWNKYKRISVEFDNQIICTKKK
ncbi:cell division protein FtsQ/DivIB [Bacteroides sp. 51]|uniref:cell division protein FtsQ/DivIB n=1 Tax=Bacteroides sp. 51 TaxID=2302938 RepID=UPI0013D815D7|nr:cell division protein FtsQ/DivIB [Bacteroides sp. 51]NDV80366.1 cell division protein FtsQ [Bacteroides sp. 51]